MALLLLLLSLGSSAWAAEFSLFWDAPEACPNQASVEQRIQSLIGGPPSEIAEQDLLVQARVERLAPDRWQLQLQTTTGGQRGDRRLEAPSCHELAEATAVLLAFAISPERLRFNQAPKPEPEPPPPEPLPPPEPTPPPPSPRAPAFEGQLQGIAAFGHVPDMAVGAAARAGLRLGNFSLRLGGLALFPTSASLDSDPSKGGDFGLVAGLFELCWQHRLERLRLGPCAGLELGALSGRGFGTDTSEQHRLLWAAPYLGVEAGVELVPRLLLVGSGSFSAALARKTFALRNLGELYQPPQFGGILALGLRFETH